MSDLSPPEVELTHKHTHTAGRRAVAPGIRPGPVVGRALSLLPLSSLPPVVMMDHVPLLLAATSLSSVASSVVIPPIVSGLAESLDGPLLSLTDYTYQTFVAFILPSKI